MDAPVLLSVVVAYVALSAAVTIHVVRRQDLSRTNKVAQSIAIWVLPVFGAIALYSLNRMHDQPVARSKSASEPFSGSGVPAVGQPLFSSMDTGGGGDGGGGGGGGD